MPSYKWHVTHTLRMLAKGSKTKSLNDLKYKKKVPFMSEGFQ